MIPLTEDKSLYTALNEYSKSGAYPFHMPGHKRALYPGLPYNIDITEINGFDDLHHAEGILKNTQEKMQRLFDSEYSYMLINGSTGGILAAITAVANYGDEIIIARNCHKSLYNACELNALDIHFIYPEQDIYTGIAKSITPDSVKQAAGQYPNSKAIVITSPTYEGVISDIKSISEIAHSFGMVLITDNAHGAHQHFCAFCREGEPIENGSDIVISSLHKTLPSLTQTAAAHFNSTLASRERFEKKLSVFQTSSPSYVLMSSIDCCMDILSNSKELFLRYEDDLLRFSTGAKSLQNLHILCMGNDAPQVHGFFAFDLGKIVICTENTDINGTALSQILRTRYNIETEMSYTNYVIAMTSICDSEKAFGLLLNALTEIDKTLKPKKSEKRFFEIPRPHRSSYKPADLNALPNEPIYENGILVSRQYIYAYPPGIPIIIPGELLDDNIYSYIEHLKSEKLKVES